MSSRVSSARARKRVAASAARESRSLSARPGRYSSPALLRSRCPLSQDGSVAHISTSVNILRLGHRGVTRPTVRGRQPCSGASSAPFRPPRPGSPRRGLAGHHVAGQSMHTEWSRSTKLAQRVSWIYKGGEEPCTRTAPTCRAVPSSPPRGAPCGAGSSAPIRRRRRRLSTARSWKTKTTDDLVRPLVSDGSTRNVRGNLTASSCPVIGTTMTVGSERWQESACTTTAGLDPSCSCPGPPCANGKSTVQMSPRVIPQCPFEAQKRLVAECIPRLELVRQVRHAAPRSGTHRRFVRGPRPAGHLAQVPEGTAQR